MSRVGAGSDAWELARPDLSAGLERGDAVLVAWGVSTLTGPARAHHEAQVRWLVEQAQQLECPEAWTVDGQPRHPSRWHQYVSDRHGRTSAAPTTADRLREVLVQVAWTCLIGAKKGGLHGQELRAARPAPRPKRPTTHGPASGLRDGLTRDLCR